jgi:hypothetical protein
MAKFDSTEALDAWRKAEQRYQDVIAPFLVEKPSKLRKDDAVSITKARVKADRKLEAYLDGSLG